MDAQGGIDYHLVRKSYAARFTSPENKKYAPVLFSMLDSKDPNPVIWKMVKRVTNGVNPVVDTYTT